MALKAKAFKAKNCMTQAEEFVELGAPGGCTFPPTVNTPAESSLQKEVATELIGDASKVYEIGPIMAGEDFSYFLEKIPGSLVFLGSGDAKKESTVNLHHPRFKMDEDQMPLGIAIHVNAALKALDELNHPRLRKQRLERFGQSADKVHPGCGFTDIVDEI